MQRVAGRTALVQRVILTAVADVRLVGTDGEVQNTTVGAATKTHLCATSLGANRTAELQLVMEALRDVDYESTAACIDARIADIDCLSGRESTLSRCSSVRLRATVQIRVGSAQANVVMSACAVSPSIIAAALHRLSAMDRMLGVRDLRLASLDQRLHFLLLIAINEQRSALDETMFRQSSAAQASEAVAEEAAALAAADESRLCPIEEVGTMGLDEPCCATGCEPCVWEVYYRQQATARERLLQQSSAVVRKRPRALETAHANEHPTPFARAAASAPSAAGGELPPRPVDVEMASTAADHAQESILTRAPPTCASDCTCVLSPDTMVPVALVERCAPTTDMLLLTFGASVTGPEGVSTPPAPWHVRLRTQSADGALVTRCACSPPHVSPRASHPCASAPTRRWLSPLFAARARAASLRPHASHTSGCTRATPQSVHMSLTAS